MDDQSHPAHTRAELAAMWLCLAAVMTGAFYASYSHALTVCEAADGRHPVAFVMAGLADPVICAASLSIAAAARRGLPLPGWSIASAVVAVTVTLVMNVSASDPRAVPAWLVNAWVPVALGLTLESIISFTRRGRVRVPAHQPDHPGPAAHHPAATTPELARAALDHQIQVLAAGMSERAVADTLGIGRPRVAAATASNGNGSHPEGP